ncbi:hypothetical protein [Aurantimonas coralicida]|uniref:hypothetical protein n=1 Tax=Aurantimonas coralicida TaxID=182270 RepID=UPI001E38FA34|nr:hypothetical protein [Aurantimonas coralicida]MCD1645639.1 hypothetical protein [Aurantimonas coralicida]
MGFLKDSATRSGANATSGRTMAPAPMPIVTPPAQVIDTGLRPTSTGITYQVATKAGSCGGRSSGYNITAGTVMHALPIVASEILDNQPAACGAQPAIAWSDQRDEEVTCPKCR